MVELTTFFVVAVAAGAVQLTPACAGLYGRNVTKDQRVKLGDAIFNEARALAGLSPLAPVSPLTRGEQQFFFVNHGDFFCNNMHASYRMVWKAGNTFIRENLKRAGHCTGYSLKQGLPRDNSSFIFSFVRDPFSHFVSGWREAMLRTFFSCCDVTGFDRRNASFHDKVAPGDPIRCKYGCEDFVSIKGPTRLAKAYLRDLLDATLLDENRHFQHVALMSGNLFGNKALPLPDFIGVLENLRADWERMCRAHQCPLHLQSAQDLDVTLGQHPGSSSDMYGHGAGLLRAFKEEPPLLAAVHRLIMIDEQCLSGWKSLHTR